MNRWKAFIAAVLVMSAIGCSGGGAAVVPGTLTGAHDGASNSASHNLWGLWQGTIDPAAGTLEFAQLRTSEFHLNALPFLEPPPLANVTLESLSFNGDLVNADIGIRHPFLGLTEFTGFDVCGVFITHGSVSGFTDAGVLMPGPDDTRMLNPDGYTRWWNPAEFPVNEGTMFSYNDGLLGTPDSIANFSATVNGYKLYTDELTLDDPISGVTLSKRNMFSAGQKNVRHYTIELGGDGLIFNYAIDACWEFPSGSSPWDAPDDFGPGANRPEAWNANVDVTGNTLWNDGADNGGTLTLTIDVYDHFSPELNTVAIESPGNFAIVESSESTGAGEGYAAFELSTTDATPAQDSVEILITVVSEQPYGDYLPGKNIASYFTLTVPVADEEYDPCLDLIEVDKSSYGLHFSKSMQIIYDQPTWEAWWAVAVGNVFPTPPTPEIDWENEMVIAVTMGQHNSSGYYPTIDWACFDTAGDLEIYVTWHHPGPGCMVLWVMTQPWLAVKTERHEVDHYWTEEIDIYSCD